MWDAARKCIELSCNLAEKEDLEGWRKASDWQKRMKSQYRKVQKTKKGGGKNKEERLEKDAIDYLELATTLSNKVDEFKSQLAPSSISAINLSLQLDYFHEMLDKHIDLVNRRLLKGEKIPHSEKLFSLFEPHTKWLNKGKAGIITELGQKHLIVTDQNHFIVHHELMGEQQDVTATVDLANKLKEKFGDHIASLSLDKGFSSTANIKEIEDILPATMLKQKGRLNKARKEIEYADDFKALYNAHQAVESNINQLEYHGLDKCPDKGEANFKKYVSLAVLSYNMHRTGTLIKKQLIAKQKALKKKEREKKEA